MVTPLYKKRVKIMREKYQLSYSDIGKKLKVSPRTAMRIYKTKKYQPTKATKEKIEKNYYVYLQKDKAERVYDVKRRFIGQKKGYKVTGLTTRNYSLIRRRIRINRFFTEDSSDSEINKFIKLLKQKEKLINYKIRNHSIGGHCVFWLSYYRWDDYVQDWELIHDRLPVSSYHYDTDEGGVRIAIETGAFDYITAKLRSNDYLAIRVHAVDLIYNVI